MPFVTIQPKCMFARLVVQQQSRQDVLASATETGLPGRISLIGGGAANAELQKDRGALGWRAIRPGKSAAELAG
jgi:hypothetical protein